MLPIVHLDAQRSGDKRYLAVEKVSKRIGKTERRTTAKQMLAALGRHIEDAGDFPKRADREGRFQVSPMIWPNGREKWDKWSSTSFKYDEPGQETAWRSFDRPYGREPGKLATLFEIAIEHGWQEAKAEYNASGTPDDPLEFDTAA